MKVSEINSKTNFKAIKLTRKESNKIGIFTREYRSLGNLEARAKIVDIFTPHIEKEAKAKVEENNNLSIKDYSQNLHLKLLEKIETVNLNFHPVTELINNLNSYNPQKDDYFTLSENKSIEELTPEEEYTISNKEQSTLNEKMHQVVSICLYRDENRRMILHDFLDDYTEKELARKYNLYKNTIREKIEQGIYRIKTTEQNGRSEIIYKRTDNFGCKSYFVRGVYKGVVSSILNESY